MRNIAGGSFYHFGIRAGLVKELAKYPLIECASLSLQINIDGLPLFKSSQDQFWPILCMIDNLQQKSPFVAGLFHGKCKPTSMNEYLEDFVNEMELLKCNGLQYKENQYDVNISAVVCDASARAMVKMTKYFCGYFGYDKCTQKGERILNRITFPQHNSEARRDVSFNEMED